MKEGGSKNTSSRYFRFRCEYCGRKIKIEKKHAGKKAKCSVCKKSLIVPRPGVNQAQSEKENPPLQSRSSDPLSDIQFLDLPKKKSEPSLKLKALAEQTDTSTSETIEQASEGQTSEQAAVGRERPLPAVIDIFLYPLNKSGLSMFGIIIGIPLLYGLFVALMVFLGLFNPLFLLVFILLMAVSFVIGIIFGMYVFWYLCECIRDSGFGAIRAPETISITPGLGELFSQFIKVIGTLAFFTLPAIAYYLCTHQHNTIFLSLLSAGLFLYPMALLSVIMFDSFYGLNPVLVIGSVFSTFFAYIGLLLFLASFFILTKFLLPLLMMLSGFGGIFMLIGVMLLYSTGIMNFYIMMVAAHLLGRFYFRYQEKLNWEV